MPTAGEHPPTQKRSVPLRLGGFKIHTCCGVHLGGNFLTQLALGSFKEELMVHKGDVKEGKRKKRKAAQKKETLLPLTLSLQCEVI